MRPIFWCFSFLALVALAPPALGQLPAVPFVEPDQAAASIELVSEPASYDRPAQDSFTVLSSEGRCSRTRLGGIDVELIWESRRPQVTAQRVDLSMFRDGFSAGRFLTSGERPAAERGLVFDAPEPGINYYWRLLSRTPEGWVVSGSGRVKAPICPVDKVYE